MKLPLPLTIVLAFAQTAAVLYYIQLYAFGPSEGVNDVEGQDRLLYAGIFHGVMALFTVVSVMFVTAPYGRHAATSIVKITVDTRAAWILQEMPTLIAVGVGLSSFVAVHGIDGLWARLLTRGDTILTVPLFCFVLHYTHRTLIFPFMLRPRNDTPVHIMLLANVYCCFNGWLQISNLTRTGYNRDSSSNSSAQDGNVAQGTASMLVTFWENRTAEEITGFAVFLIGMSINLWADYTLIGLRKTPKHVTNKAPKKNNSSPASDKSNYVIPHGGLFEFVSCPNFLGECVEWLGFTLATVGAADQAAAGGHFTYAPLAAFTFFLYTASNTIPRAFAHHEWYKKTFGWEYEKLNRTVVVPFVL